MKSVQDEITAFYAKNEQLDLDIAHYTFDIWSLGTILFTLMAIKEYPRTRLSDEEKQKPI